MCEILKPFFTITNLISGSSYPTSNLYFGEIWKIECLIRSYLTSEDLLIQKMAESMKVKFDKYWSDYNVVLAVGAVLDPTKKFNFLKFAYEKLDPLTSEEKLKKVKMTLGKLFSEYIKNGIPSNLSSSQVQPSYGGGTRITSSSYDEFEEYESQSSSNTGKSELDTYLDELRMPLSAEFDVLAFWKERSRRSPNLARMACDILSIPITTVASESAFSIGARVVNRYRSSMKDDSVQALLCARSWLHGFEELYDDNNDVQEDETHGSGQASNSTVDVVNLEED
ncbi:zinc finger BED domain-containing protein DAYSLEEPER-like [Medicago truncatula]|uniref:zinc finger BED domain-containing protein DAYSLEEPER-like n=1 Tax=Medicago truncatula TaxID=3880 RepID=UPI001967CA2D|nr:zinc finger BED domain-containing protein DAYSLEEPER-like [Medicago truncatula]